MSKARARQGRTSQSNAPLYVALCLVAVLVVFWLAWAGGSVLSGRGEQVTVNAPAAAIQVLSGQAVWPAMSTVLLIVLFAAAIGLVVLVLRRKPAKSFAQKQLEDKASVMATAGQTSGLTLKSAKKSAARLFPGANLDDPAQCGQRLGMMMDRRTPVYVSWEWVAVCLAGPRSGKTLAFAVPSILTAPGAVVATSNKQDILNATHADRADKGTVWVSDLQHISTSGGQDWWWDPLRGIDRPSQALELANYFVTSSRAEPNARVDSYFDGGAQAVLALNILAAAVSGGDMMHVYGWLSSPDLTLPADLLRSAGQHIASERLLTASKLNPRQRDGLYDMARKFIAVMEEPRYAAAVLPPTRVDYGEKDSSLGRQPRPMPCTGPELVIEDFVRSTDTLYLLSQEGPAAATPLTTALVGSVFQAAVRYARESGGRLPIPMVAILDEAANVCKLGELPNWYSHFGSQGIVVWTFVQSLPQAQGVWGVDGTDALMSAANVHIYGGGGKELGGSHYLQALSNLIGTRDVSRWTTSVNGNGPLFGDRSRSQQWTAEPILSVDELSALDPEYAILLASGNSPILIRKEFSTDEKSPHYEAVRRSKASIALPVSAASSPAQRAVLAATASTPGTYEQQRKKEVQP